MSAATSESAGSFWSRRLRGVIPAVRWLREYNARAAGADLTAGVTLAAYSIPAALGVATLAALPPEAGLYACLWGGLVFWLFCSSRQTAITVTSAISLLIGTTVGSLADGDPSRFAAIAAAVALLTAAIAIVAWLARAGSAVNFISETVMIGFKVGVALQLASSQLPKLFGVKGGQGGFWECMQTFIRNLGQTNLPSVLLGCIALTLLILGKKFLPNRPVALFIVIGGIIAASVVDLGSLGVQLLGEVPRGIPLPASPGIALSDLRNLLPLALACFMLAAVETAAIGRMFAEKKGYRLDSNQELLGLAAANLAAGFGHGYPVSGGMSQSLVNESGGARSPLSGLFSAALIAVVALFFSDLLRSLPQPVLAAIVLMSVASLVKLDELRHLWRFHRGEFLIAMMALFGVLWAGLLQGVLLGAIISLVLLIRRASSPHVAFLGRIPGTRRFSDLRRHPDNVSTPGVLAFRVESSIIYFNAEHVFDAVLARVSDSPDDIRLVICDLSTSPSVDMAGARMLLTLQGELTKRGIELQIVEAHAAVRDMLRTEDVHERMGRVDRFRTIADVLEHYSAKNSLSSPA